MDWRALVCLLFRFSLVGAVWLHVVWHGGRRCAWVGVLFCTGLRSSGFLARCVAFGVGLFGMVLVFSALVLFVYVFVDLCARFVLI